MRKINWVCPSCGGTKISMIEDDVVVTTPILAVDPPEDILLDKANAYCEYLGKRRRYMCHRCEHLVATGQDSDFIEAIKDYLEVVPELPANRRYLHHKDRIRVMGAVLEWDAYGNGGRFIVPDDFSDDADFMSIDGESFIAYEGNGIIRMNDDKEALP